MEKAQLEEFGYKECRTKNVCSSGKKMQIWRGCSFFFKIRGIISCLYADRNGAERIESLKWKHKKY